MALYLMPLQIVVLSRAYLLFKKPRFGVAAVMTRFLVVSGPQSLPRLHEASLDGTAVLFTSHVSTACGDADSGIENVHPHVNRICAFIGKLRQAGWFDDATPEKRAALKRDLKPVVELYSAL